MRKEINVPPAAAPCTTLSEAVLSTIKSLGLFFSASAACSRFYNYNRIRKMLHPGLVLISYEV